ncbi:MAG: hypothetical protein PHP35_02165 [Candidatus Colwellbacteria bacterium]|nr:hypothetical protein [Candidatus Colwellbacteria bacterium]
MKKINVILAVIFLSAPVYLAQAATMNVQNGRQGIIDIRRGLLEERAEAKQVLVQTVQSMRQEAGDAAEALREETRTRLEAIKNDATLSIEERRLQAEQIRVEAQNTLQEGIESARQAIISNREEFKNQIQAIREEAKQEIEAERERLRTSLQSIADERKQQIVERVAEQIQNVNVNYIDRLTVVLNNLEEVLRGISSRADKAELNGKDVSQVRADIVAAEEMIAKVRGYIAAQSGTTYPITITDEENLGENVSDARNRLHADLSILKDEVTKVRDAVRKAAEDLASIPGVNDEATDSE